MQPGPWQSWAVSVPLPALLVVVLGLLLVSDSRPAPIPPRTVGIVIKQQQAQEVQFLDESSARAPRSSQPALGSVESSQLSLSKALDEPRPELADDDPLTAELDARAVIGASSAVAGAGGLTSGVGNSRGNFDPLPQTGEAVVESAAEVPDGPAARTRLFGLEAEGHRFVYVLDHSKSMGRHFNNILERAKREVAGSLRALETNHRFQLICYNDSRSVFRVVESGELPVATDANRAAATEFLGTIGPQGGTKHFPALLAALAMRPDVIFLMTDAQPPGLNRLELDTLSAKAGERVTIHAIEFGLVDEPEAANFLQQLAAENGGSYRYVNVMAPP